MEEIPLKLRVEVCGTPGGLAEPDWPIWHDPASARLLGETMWVSVLNGSTRVASWLVPIDRDSNGLHARRPIRFLPYACPRILIGDPMLRRSIWYRLVTTLAKHVVSIELPLSPGSVDVGAVSEAGGFLETRHTNTVDNYARFERCIPAKARNHFKAAERQCSVSETVDPSSFEFERAIIGQSPSVVDARREFGMAAARTHRVWIFNASSAGQVLGQLFVLHSGSDAIVMHAWFERDSPVRGVSTLLYVHAIRKCLLDSLIRRVDLEGSVISSIDRFMSHLGTQQSRYSMLYYSSDPWFMANCVVKNLGITGRKRS